MFSQNDPTAVSKWKHDFSVMQSALFATIKRSQLPEEMINELTWSVTEGKNIWEFETLLFMIHLNILVF